MDDIDEEIKVYAEEDEEEEYKAHANLLKDQGNEAFQAGDIQGAITLFTQAIDLDPDNHVFYSNRAAAYMKGDSKSKALRDAEKCLELAPDFVKGYSRLGAAQQSLKRFDQANDTYKKGIELDPNNKALWAALKSCEIAKGKDRKYKAEQGARERAQEEARLKRQNEIKAQIAEEKKRQDIADKEAAELNGFFSEVAAPAPSSSSSNESKEAPGPTGGEGEDFLLADFFSEIAPTESNNSDNSKKRKLESEGGEVDGEGGQKAEDEEEEKSAITEKYQNQDLGNGRDQHARLLATHYEWRNLNPFYVFQLGIDATEEDIKFRYKKLSLKVHPDRLRDVENAREAFEQVKKAYALLMDETEKKNIILHVEGVIEETTRARKRLLSKGVKERDMPTLEDEINTGTMKHFAEIERMRRVSERNKQAYKERDKQQEEEEKEKQEKYTEFDKNWTEDNRRDDRIGDWRSFQTAPDAKKAKAANFTVESREVKKHGQAKLETWKKSWK